MYMDELAPEAWADRALASVDLPPGNLIAGALSIQNFGGVYTVRPFDGATRQTGAILVQGSRATVRRFLIKTRKA